MKSWLRAAAFALSLAPMMVFAATPHVVTRVEPPGSGNNSSGVVRITVTNDGDASAFTSRNQLPEVSSQGKLLNSIIEVKRDDGQQATYHGTFAESSPSAMGWIELRPGEARTYSVDIGANYDIGTGLYHVKMSAIEYTEKPLSKGEDGKVYSSEPSNMVEVWFTSSANHRQTALLPASGTPGKPGACAGDVQAAIDAAKAMNDAAFETVRKNSGIYEDGVHFKPDARWATWFGSREEVKPDSALSGNGLAYARVFHINLAFNTNPYFGGSMPQFRCDVPCAGDLPEQVAHPEYANPIPLGEFASTTIV
jgi:hypothetical protein